MDYTLALIQQNNLQQADAVVLRKKFLGMIDHFAIFLGFDENGFPFFVANYNNGIQRVQNHELDLFMQTLEPTRVEKFVGSQNERQQAVNRAIFRIGENAYDYFANNCESFKNYVQIGMSYSLQAKNFNKIAEAIGICTAIAGIVALAANNPKIATWALGISALAAIAWDVSKKANKN